MTWFKVDDSFHSHPKALAASLAALGLWSVAGAWAGNHLTDGFIPDHVVPLLARGQSELADELVAAGLWSRSTGGYQFHQWADRNPSRSDVEATRSQSSSGAIVGNHRRWHVAKGIVKSDCPLCQEEQEQDSDRGTDRGADSDPDRTPNPPGPSRPDPARPDPGDDTRRQDPSGGVGGDADADASGQTDTTKPTKSTKKKTDRGHRLPDDFEPDEAMKAWARENAPSCGREDHEAFCDYWRGVAGAKGRKVDWVATWRNWMRREHERRTSRTSHTRARSSTTDDRAAQALEAGRDAQRERESSQHEIQQQQALSALTAGR